MTESQIITTKNLLSTAKKAVIIPHRNPDGDAMGSTLALYHYLKNKGIESTVLSPNEFPDFLSWLPGSTTVKLYERDKASGKSILEEADLIFTLDFNAFHRTGEMEQELITLQTPFILIDHHEAPANYAAVTFSDTKYGSTCEMIFDFIEALGDISFIDKTIATCLYTGIVTDSGSFKFPKTTGKTHRIVAKLIDLGVENSEIHNLLFNNNSYEKQNKNIHCCILQYIHPVLLFRFSGRRK